MDFLPHSLTHTIEKGWTTTQNDVLEKILPNSDIAFEHWIVAIFVNTFKLFEWGLVSSFLWLEKNLSCFEPFFTDQYFSSVRQFIIFLTGMTLFSIFLGSFVIINNKTHFLFYVFDNFNFSIGGKAVASTVQKFLQMRCDVATSKMNSLDGVRNGIAFVYWYCVRNTITWVENDTSSTTIGIECKYSLNTNIEAWHVEHFEHNLSHLFPIFLWI